MPSESKMLTSSKATRGGRAGRVPDGDDDLVGAHPMLTGAAADDNRVVVDEPGPARDQRHPVPGQLVPDHFDLPSDDVMGPSGQVLHGDVLFHRVALPVEVTLRHAGEVENGFSQGLGRDRAGVDADASDDVAALDDRGPPSELRRCDGGLLAAGTAPDHQQVIVAHIASVRGGSPAVASLSGLPRAQPTRRGGVAAHRGRAKKARQRKGKCRSECRRERLWPWDLKNSAEPLTN